MTKTNATDTDNLPSATANNQRSINKPDDSIYLTPAAVLIGSIIVAIAILIGPGTPGATDSANLAANDDEVAEVESGDNRLAIALQAAEVNPAEIEQCINDNEYASEIAADIQNATETGGRGTPWTIVVDRQTGERYPIGGALPAEAVNELLDNNFDGLPETAFENINLKAVTAVSADDYYRGPGDARYVFIEYSDFNCGYCARFHSTMKNLLDTRSDVGWVYRQFAILNNSESVANVAECVGEGGENEDAFWQFADAYFNQS